MRRRKRFISNPDLSQRNARLMGWYLWVVAVDPPRQRPDGIWHARGRPMGIHVLFACAVFGVICMFTWHALGTALISGFMLPFVVVGCAFAALMASVIFRQLRRRTDVHVDTAARTITVSRRTASFSQTTTAPFEMWRLVIRPHREHIRGGFGGYTFDGPVLLLEGPDDCWVLLARVLSGDANLVATARKWGELLGKDCEVGHIPELFAAMTTEGRRVL